MKHLVVGAGVVGSATGVWLEANKEKVYYTDVKTEALEKLVMNDKKIVRIPLPTDLPSLYKIENYDIIWICTAEWDVEDILKTLNLYKIKSIIVVRSTTRPGTIKDWSKKYDLNLFHVPEFLKQATSIDDIFHPDRIIIGKTKRTEKPLKDLFSAFYPQLPIVITDSTSSELIKLTANAWLSTQITFWNEIKKLCDKMKLNPQHIAECVCLDHRISNYGSKMTGDPISGFCVLPTAKIKTISSLRSIENLYNYYQKRFYPRLKTESCNSVFEKINYKEIKSVTKRDVDEYLYEFETENGKFACTAKHLIPVLRNGRYILLKAVEITEDDWLIAKEKCKICHNTFEDIGRHLKAHNISPKDYYDTYVKSNQGRCKNCGRQTKFISIAKGYNKYCSRNCSGKDLWKSQDYRDKVMTNQRRTIDTPEYHEKMREALKGVHKGDKNPMKRPEVRKKVSTFRKDFFKYEANRKKVSDLTKKAWAEGKFDGVAVGQCRWYNYNHSNGKLYKVQGTWELAFIKWLEANNLTFACHRGKIPYLLNGELKYYLPDFFVDKWNSYVDVKCRHFYNKEKFDAIRISNPDTDFKVLFKEDLKRIGVKFA